MRPFGEYILTAEIGEGGMGKVFRAWKFSHEGFKKIIAIKILKSQKDLRFFINEAKISARFEHENVVKTIDFGRVGDEFFLAMEYIRGVNLREFMEVVKEVQIDIFLFIAEKILSAVEYIHRFEGKFLVHRDINPRNILISWTGGVKLTDFGITLPTRSEIDPFGKVGYTPPEILTGGRWSQLGDIWCVGVLFWEMLTSQRLFSGESREEVKKKILNSEIQPPSEINPLVPPELDKIVLKSLAKVPNLRYADIGEITESIKEFSRNKGIKPIFQDDFSAFIKDVFHKRIKEEEQKILSEERELAKLNIEKTGKAGGISLNTTGGISLNTKEKRRSKRKKDKPSLLSLSIRGIQSFALALGFLIGFTMGIVKSVLDIRDAQESFSKGMMLFREKNFREAKENFEKSLKITGIQEISDIITKIEMIKQ